MLAAPISGLRHLKRRAFASLEARGPKAALERVPKGSHFHPRDFSDGITGVLSAKVDAGFAFQKHDKIKEFRVFPPERL